jgi:hypothetical protein
MYSPNMPVVYLDDIEKSKPDVVIPSPASITKTTSLIAMPNRLLQTLVNTITSPLRSFVTVETPTPARIISFDVTNGIWSLEWTYILFACAMKGSILASYDLSKNQYTYGSSNDIVGSCYECMLFQDPHITSDSSNNLSNGTKFMQAYCNLRNRTLAYIDYKRGDNSCVCQTDNQFCAKTMNAKCSRSNGNYFVGDDVAKDKCSEQAINNYCQITNTQIEIATKYGVNTDGLNKINIDGGCGEKKTNTEAPEDTESSEDTSVIGEIPIIVWILLVILIVVIFGAIAVGGYFYATSNNI